MVWPTFLVRFSLRWCYHTTMCSVNKLVVC